MSILSPTLDSPVETEIYRDPIRRKKPSELLLEYQNLPQCVGAYRDGNGGFCALGIIRVFGSVDMLMALRDTEFAPDMTMADRVLDLNDTHGKTFKQIALILQEYDL